VFIRGLNPTERTAGVELRGVTKRFGDVVANAGVDLRIEHGTIHGIVGENGAGKSTAMKLLYGLYRPDSGEILINGTVRRWASPSDAIASGIGMVHQHFMLAGPHSALDNILLGAEPVRFGVIDRTIARKRLENLAEQYGLRVDWDQAVEEMPVGLQQRIEILKLLYREANILILDEPTGVLTPQETNNLFGNLRKLRDQGKTVIFVTHKLREIMAFTDRVTVFRSGKVVGEAETAKTNPQQIADMMVGRKVSLQIPMMSAKGSVEAGIEADALTLTRAGEPRDRLSKVTFKVRRGEIVGIAGVEGNGQSELIQALLHPRDSFYRTSGEVKILGQNVTHSAARQIRELGVAFIPEDRLHEGLLPERPLIENIFLGHQREPAFRNGQFLNLKNLRESAIRATTDYDVRPNNLNLPAAALSGGNQQKLIIAREFHKKPHVLIAAQPTRGVDVGAIEFIHKRIVRARDEGAAVLLISSELEEILTLSDRILVMYEGRIAGEFQRGNVTERELGLAMGGASA
jgi:simple sugar transport system ATP-binding protein